MWLNGAVDSADEYVSTARTVHSGVMGGLIRAGQKVGSPSTFAWLIWASTNSPKPRAGKRRHTPTPSAASGRTPESPTPVSIPE